GPAADPRRGEGPHGSLADRQRRLQAAKAQPERHRDQEDTQPRPLADRRPRLAGGRADRPRLRQAVRPGQAELGRLVLPPTRRRPKSSIGGRSPPMGTPPTTKPPPPPFSRRG